MKRFVEGGRDPLQAAHPRKGQRGDEPSRSCLQSEADDRHPRGAPAHPGDEGRPSPSPYENIPPPANPTALPALPHRLSSPFRTASSESGPPGVLSGRTGILAKADDPPAPSLTREETQRHEGRYLTPYERGKLKANEVALKRVTQLVQAFTYWLAETSEIRTVDSKSSNRLSLRFERP